MMGTDTNAVNLRVQWKGLGTTWIEWVVPPRTWTYLGAA